MNTYDDILEGIQTEALRGQLNDALKQYETFSDPAHGVQHIREVVDAARKIHAESGVDQEQLLTAAILHDIGRDVQFKGGEGHEIAGARLAKPYIGTFAPGVQRNILHAIRQHRTEGRPRTMLAKLVRDADKLPDKINPGSTFRRLAEYRLAQGYTDPKQIAEDARQYVLNGRASDNARLLTPQARALAAPMRAEIHELRRDPAGWYNAMLPYLKTSAEKDPRRWQTVIVKSPYASLTKQDVHDYYKTPTVQKQILDAVGKNEVIVRQSFTPKAIVLRRKNEAGELIKMPDAAALQTWNMKRLTEVHPTFGKKVDFVLADIDPQKGVPWSKTKSITETVAKTMTSHPRVKDVEVRFSGGRGFYVTGRLDGEIGVDSARSLTKRMLDGITKRPDVTFGEAAHGQIRLDVSPLKYRGSVRAPYSLNAQTGLVSVPIALDKLPKVKKEDFTMNRALKGLIKNSAEFVPLIFGLADDIPAIMRMIHRNRVAASPYPHAVFPYPQEDPQQQVLKRAAAEFAPGIPKNKKIQVQISREEQKLAGSKLREGFRLLQIGEDSFLPTFRGKVIGGTANVVSPGSALYDAAAATQIPALHRVKALVPQFMGKGLGKKMYGEIMRAKGGKLTSDAWRFGAGSSSPASQRVWASMAKTKGYKITKNPKAIIGEGGTLMGLETGDPAIIGELPHAPPHSDVIRTREQLYKEFPEAAPNSARAGNPDGINYEDFRTGRPSTFAELFDKKSQEDPQQQVLKRAAAEFAPGIPKNKKIHKIPTAENQPWALAVQKHIADKAGPHWDLRLVPGIGGHAHSWAVPKMKFPEPGKMQLAIQQPTHTADYALNFEGKIPKGTYGAGKVTMPIKEQVNIIKAGPDKVVFQRPNQDKYTLFRMGDTKWGITKSVKHAAEELYHGSTDSHDTLQPMPVPGLSGKKLLYAAPRRGVALAYTRRWSDNDLGQGFVSPDEPAYLTEMRPNAFKDIFEGQPGYLHTVPAETFRPLGDTAISGEHVSEKPVKATKVEHIADALQALKDSGVVLNEYDPTSVAFKQEMAGMKHRAANMKPADRKRYLGWRLRNSTKDVKDAWKAKEAAASVLDRVQKSEQSKRSTAFIRQRLRGL